MCECARRQSTLVDNLHIGTIWVHGLNPPNMNDDVMPSSYPIAQMHTTAHQAHIPYLRKVAGARWHGLDELCGVQHHIRIVLILLPLQYFCDFVRIALGLS